jgi:hypothetical protein
MYILKLPMIQFSYIVTSFGRSSIIAEKKFEDTKADKGR